ncbi:Npun_F0494 family protein [Synechococcus sp. A15-24]|uniref:Npun_F0494 family protein n=1 Tax=Synechococcus sp. A15-24 TaxID=1050635 RepID=UPI0025708171|nr:Npun_F0494 family protein [Synechococcus sp. A15-24]
MRCLPFAAELYRELQQQGLDAHTIWQNRSRFGRGPSWPGDGERLEDDLRWLITVGVLRREVDGQGLTSRFRLTPLGRDLLDSHQAELLKPADWNDRLRHALRRRWPF